VTKHHIERNRWRMRSAEQKIFHNGNRFEWRADFRRESI